MRAMEIQDSPPQAPTAPEHANGAVPAADRRTRRTAAEIEEWLVEYLAKELKCRPSEVDVTVPFDRFGLSSITAVFMTSSLEEWLGSRLDPTLPFDYPTIETLAGHLAVTEP
jgi:acyl carrier protein